LVILGLIIAAMAMAVVFDPEFRQAFTSILPVPISFTQGLGLTLYLTAGSFVVATFLGLWIGLGRISKRPWIRNVAAVYIEFIRGIPMIVFIFAIALFIVPDFADLIRVNSRSIPMAIRGAAALSLFYAAFIAEVFRAGIQSVPVTQAEAGKALGLSDRQVMRKVVLPQAVRNMLPALGNDLISLMKDTSLVSILAVRELTQMARLYAGSTFRIRESFLIIMVLYVVLTLTLSLILRWYEKRIAIPGRLETSG
jgi:polar amino acid transport system permease protein